MSFEICLKVMNLLEMWMEPVKFWHKVDLLETYFFLYLLLCMDLNAWLLVSLRLICVANCEFVFLYLDTENIRFVFAAVKDTILQSNLKEYNLV
jgi:hypothetical protein